MNAEIYKCVVSSPSDTQEERDACDKVFEKINRTLGNQLKFRIESRKWEADVHPAIGEDAQSVISEQLLDDYQLFVGIMWKKFGTPTKKAASGTEEEFLDAYLKNRGSRNVEVMFYFNQTAFKPNDIDPAQVKKVQDFKSRASELGVFYSDYAGVDDFEEKLFNHMSSYFIKRLSSRSNDPRLKEESTRLKEISLRDSVRISLKKRLNDALSSFSDQPLVWIDPVLSKSKDISKNPDKNYESKVDINELVANPLSLIIKAPPQFGLTCLAHYLVLEAWNKNHTWVYLDWQKIKMRDMKKCVERELDILGLAGRDVDCIVLDSWICTEAGSMKALRNLCSSFINTPVIVMQTIDDSKFHTENDNEVINRDFKVYHLLALPRNKIREVVSTYNRARNIGNEDIIVERVTKDLEILNIHRTALNCLTLLKASELHSNERLVNRTKLIEMVLFALFDLDQLPTYKIRPDVKDCEFVLGRFCEEMIRANSYSFDRDYFLKTIDGFCKEKLIELEVGVVFDILFKNNIIVRRDDRFSFRAVYWIYYFAAQRMYISKDFCDYIFYEKGYASFPEIIEFYTGIDRNRDDILRVFVSDLRAASDLVENKTGLPEDLNPYHLAQWHPSKENLQMMEAEIAENVKASNLPDELKDRHADRSYDQLRPYRQSVETILEEYSFLLLMGKIKAASRALRNSDYADTETKRELLREITRGWGLVSKILFALTPMLASKGYAAFDGAGFYLSDEFPGTTEERINRIILVNPTNVIGFFKDDLFSDKMGPLLFDSIEHTKNNLIKHHLMLLLISERPRGWRECIEKYIESVSKNSFYLYDVVCSLGVEYKYGFSDEKQLSVLQYLLKMAYAKHEFGDKKPGLDKIKRISNKVLPERSVEE
jgi:hypothetical protein